MSNKLIEGVASQFQVTKVLAKSVVDYIVESIVDGTKVDGKFKVTGLGTFKTKKRAAKTARNPQTGGTVAVPAKTVFTFTPTTSVKELVK